MSNSRHAIGVITNLINDSNPVTRTDARSFFILWFKRSYVTVIQVPLWGEMSELMHSVIYYISAYLHVHTLSIIIYYPLNVRY